MYTCDSIYIIIIGTVYTFIFVIIFQTLIFSSAIVKIPGENERTDSRAIPDSGALQDPKGSVPTMEEKDTSPSFSPPVSIPEENERTDWRAIPDDSGALQDPKGSISTLEEKKANIIMIEVSK